MPVRARMVEITGAAVIIVVRVLEIFQNVGAAIIIVVRVLDFFANQNHGAAVIIVVRVSKKNSKITAPPSTMSSAFWNFFQTKIKIIAPPSTSSSAFWKKIRNVGAPTNIIVRVSKKIQNHRAAILLAVVGVLKKIQNHGAAVDIIVRVLEFFANQNHRAAVLLAVVRVLKKIQNVGTAVIIIVGVLEIFQNHGAAVDNVVRVWNLKSRGGSSGQQVCLLYTRLPLDHGRQPPEPPSARLRRGRRRLIRVRRGGRHYHALDRLFVCVGWYGHCGRVGAALGRVLHGLVVVTVVVICIGKIGVLKIIGGAGSQ